MAWAMVAGAAVSVVGGAVAANSAKKTQAAQNQAIADANEKGGIPDWARPYVDDAMGKAQAVANKPYEAYTGKLVADRNPYETAAATGIADWAKGTPQSNQAASAYSGMVSNPTRFNAGAAPTSAAYADNHLGTLNQSQAQSTTTERASNPYIGAQTQGIAGADKVGGLLGSNPYLGATSGSVKAGKNALLGMNNPYLNDAINYATEDITRNYERTTAPGQAQRMAASGSFGNTGLMSQDSEERRNLAGELGRTASGMRMQDYSLQAQLGEADVGRNLAADQFNVNTRAGDLGRNLAGSFQQQGMGLDAEKFNANNQQQTQQFNAGLSQADLARNASLMGQQSQFNAAAQTGASQWNAGNQTQNNQFNTSAANNMSLANAGIQNNTNQFNVNNLNNASNFNANAASQMNQFNSTQAANQYSQGVNGLMNIDGRGLQANQALGLLGSNERGIDQQGLTASYDQWLRAQSYPQQQSANYNSALGTLVKGTNPQVPQQQVSPALQGVGTGLALWGALKPSNTVDKPSLQQSNASQYSAGNFNVFGNYTG